MCDFKVGDEVVCVEAHERAGLKVGHHYTIKDIAPSEKPFWSDTIVVFLMELRNDGGGEIPWDTGFFPGRFRKVQRRNLEEWLTQSVGNTDKLDKRRKVKA